MIVQTDALIIGAGPCGLFQVFELGLLGIKELRRGANGNDPKAANAANYDESKANQDLKLPDPLVLKNG